MLPLTGYLDRLSARPGERLEIKASCVDEGPCEARLVRLISTDPNPAGPGRIEEDLGDIFATRFAGRRQTHDLGSYAVMPSTSLAGGVLEVSARVWPTLFGRGEQAVLSAFDPATGRGLALCLDDDGVPMARLGLGADADDGAALRAGAPLALRRWHRVWLRYDPATGELLAGQEEIHPPFGVAEPATARLRRSPGDLPAAPSWHLAALGRDASGRMTGLFNGKIERPQIHLDGALVAAWDFAQDISGTRVTDTGPHGRHGRLVNMPARAMRGADWTGRETCWRHAPDQYAAIHFHDDDLTDCGWETDFALDLPADLRSGIYGIRLSRGAQVDTIPFFVPPPQGKRTADLCVLMSTLTYVVYANFDRVDFDDSYRTRAAELGMEPLFPGDHPEYGFSTYNVHADGSGICHASPHRPMLNMRPGFMNNLDDAGSGMRHFSADMHLIAWLEAKGIAYDVVTDHELDEEGEGLLAPYRAVLTGSHPEYHTGETLDALLAYRNGGGRFCYLGGNGFYWRVARHQEAREVVEIRRGEGGIRAWASEPGEYYNAFDGAYGGLWRRQDRPPQALAGVGFSAQGQFEGSLYRLTAAARQARAGWIFDCVPGETIGDFGLSGGGAAGFELDRADVGLGTPGHALILARSEGHSDTFVLVHEEQLTHLKTLPGEPAADLIRAEIVFFETPAGGAVFSTGSITFCGSLPSHGFDNDVSTMLENVVRRFLDPSPFAMPTG
ncbi:MAG: N,N-dimethylformamidase beta subunit family domain-containing protein [Pseudomonadota bacterium]